MSYSMDAIPPYLSIGNQMENNAAAIAFDISAWQAEFPEIACAITMIAPGGGAPFLVSGVSQQGSALTWTVGRDATQRSGVGSIVIRGLVGDVEKRSLKRSVTVENGHAAAGEAPAGAADWLSEAAAAEAARVSAEAARETAVAAVTGMTVEAAGLAEGEAPTVAISQAEGVKHIAFGIPAGAKGETGATGDPGPTGTVADVPRTANADAAPALGEIVFFHEYYCTNAAPTLAPTLTIPAIAAVGDWFTVSYLARASGPAAPQITNNSGKALRYKGTDVYEGVFAPVAGTLYQLSFVYNGISLLCYVAGVA